MTKRKQKRFGKAFIVRDLPSGGYTAWFNNVPRGEVNKRGDHVKFTKVYTHCFPFVWLQRPKRLHIAQEGP